MKIVGKFLRPEEIEFFLKLYNLWEGLLAIPPPPDPPFDVETLEPLRTLPEYQWWKPEESDLAQFELQVPHWSPDFEFQESQQAANSAESADAADSWQFQEIPLDATALPRERIEGGEALLQSLTATKDKRILVLDSDPPNQEEFPEIFYD